LEREVVIVNNSFNNFTSAAPPQPATSAYFICSAPAAWITPRWFIKLAILRPPSKIPDPALALPRKERAKSTIAY
jgi:hypothetical protein